ncbi:MAG: MBL fold metallo-hydrolase [Bdellovibrionota bacterium]
MIRRKKSSTSGDTATNMVIKILGSRGSTPVSQTPRELEQNIKKLFIEFFNRGYREKSDLAKFFSDVPDHMIGGYGGNTACLEISGGGQQIIIDAGSGIRSLGYEMMAGPCGHGQGEVHILFTHFHWDHVIGLPFFTPIFVPGNKINVYAVQPELEDVFKVVFKKPYFPVPLEKLGSAIEYHVLEPRKCFNIGNLKITPYKLDHPDPCWGYKIECGGRTLSYCVDTECTRVTHEQLGPDLGLYSGVDLMIFDAQYTLMETIEKVDWGHAAASIGLDIAMREGIKKLVFMHHDPASSNEKIFEAETQARKYYQSQIKSARRMGLDLNDVEWSFAREGMVIKL